MFVRRQDIGPLTKKPVRLGSVSPAHKDSCKDLQQFVDDKPDTPEPDPVEDDHTDDRYSDTKSCLEQAEIREEECPLQKQATDSSRSSPSKPRRTPPDRGSKSPPHGACQKPLKPMCPTSSSSPCGSVRNTKAVCTPEPDTLTCQTAVKKVVHTPEVPSSDQAYAFANVFLQEGLGDELPDIRSCPAPSPFRHGEQRRLVSPGSKPLPKECRFRTPSPCVPEKTVCKPMYGYNKYNEPATEGSDEYLTERMKLVSPAKASVSNHGTLFSM